MMTIAERWKRLEQILPAAAGAIQRQEMRRAFYAGFSEALAALMQMAEESGPDDDLGTALIQRLHDECKRFAQAVQEDKA